MVSVFIELCELIDRGRERTHDQVVRDVRDLDLGEGAHGLAEEGREVLVATELDDVEALRVDPRDGPCLADEQHASPCHLDSWVVRY
jgi:hypothetical protein